MFEQDLCVQVLLSGDSVLYVMYEKIFNEVELDEEDVLIITPQLPLST